MSQGFYGNLKRGASPVALFAGPVLMPRGGFGAPITSARGFGAPVASRRGFGRPTVSRGFGASAIVGGYVYSSDSQDSIDQVVQSGGADVPYDVTVTPWDGSSGAQDTSGGYSGGGNSSGGYSDPSQWTGGASSTDDSGSSSGFDWNDLLNGAGQVLNTGLGLYNQISGNQTSGNRGVAGPTATPRPVSGPTYPGPRPATSLPSWVLPAGLAVAAAAVVAVVVSQKRKG